jgi:hypothetical protein
MTSISATVPSTHSRSTAATVDVSPITTRFSAVAMIAGPVAMLGAGLLLGSVLEPGTKETLDGLRGHRAPAIAYVNLFVAAQGLLAFAWLRMGAVVARGSRRLGLVGGTLLAFGMTVMVVYNGIVLSMAYVAQAPSTDQLVTPIDDLFAVPNTGSLSPFLIVIGSICLAVGAFRSGVLPKVQALAIGLFALVPVALLGGVRPLLIVSAVAAIAGLAPTGIRELRR